MNLYYVKTRIDSHSIDIQENVLISKFIHIKNFFYDKGIHEFVNLDAISRKVLVNRLVFSLLLVHVKNDFFFLNVTERNVCMHWKI